MFAPVSPLKESANKQALVASIVADEHGILALHARSREGLECSGPVSGGRRVPSHGRMASLCDMHCDATLLINARFSGFTNVEGRLEFEPKICVMNKMVKRGERL